MNMRKVFTLCLLLLAGILSLSAQNRNGKISGTVLDAANKPLSAATVSLLSTPDNKLIKTAISDKDGKYEFVNIADGQYLVQVTASGLQKNVTKPITIDASGSTISAEVLTMQPASKD